MTEDGSPTDAIPGPAARGRSRRHDPSPGLRALMREDVGVVLERDPAVTSRSEALLYPHLTALWLHRLAHRCYRRRRFFTARLISTVGRMLSGIDIHPGATLGRRLFIDHGSALVIGETAVVGDDVTLYHQVTLGSVGWRPGPARPRGERRHPKIGNGVTVGANASVLGPVTVGDGALIGAHALVTQDVPAGMLVRAPTDSVDGARPDKGNPTARPKERSILLEHASPDGRTP